MIFYSGKDERIKRALSGIDQMFKRGVIRKLIYTKDKFEGSNCTPQILAGLVESFYTNSNVIIEEYKTPWWKRSNVLAYTTDSRRIFINTRNLDRSDASIAGTIAHELIHCVDNQDIKYYFGHGDNSPINKGQTAPYWIGKKVMDNYLASIELGKK